MSKEAYLPLAILSILASFRPIPGRMQPALKNAMSEFTVIATAAPAASILRTNGTGVVVPSGVTSASFLARVSKRAVSPVMAPAAGAPPDLELIHAEMITGVGVSIVIIGIQKAVIGKKLLQKGLVGGGEPRRVGVHICGGFLGSTESEELPGRNINVFEGFLRGRKLVLSKHTHSSLSPLQSEQVRENYFLTKRENENTKDIEEMEGNKG